MGKKKTQSDLEKVIRNNVTKGEEGIKEITLWIRDQGAVAPVAHRFAAGLSGVSSQEVIKEVEKQSGEKCKVLDLKYQGCTPVDLAIACNHVEILEELLKMGANPNRSGLRMNRRDGEKLTAHAILTAIYFQRPKCLRVLLKHNSSFAKSCPKIPNEIVYHALHHIGGTAETSRESEKVLEVLLESSEGRQAVDVKALDNRMILATPLMWCLVFLDKRFNKTAGEALKRSLEMLLMAGADPSLLSMDVSPLFKACVTEECSPEIVSLLLDHGADSNEYDWAVGETCLNAIFFQSVVDEGQIQKVKILVDHGLDINSVTPNGRKIYMASCVSWDNLKCFDIIVNNPSFRAKSAEFKIVTSRYKKESVVSSPEEKYYIYREASNSTEKNPVPNPDSSTDLLNAVTNVDIDTVESLLEKGVDVNVTDGAGDTPACHAARQANSLEILDALLSNGVGVNTRDHSGKTLLFLAAESNRIENAEYLCIDRSADVNMGESVTGTTPLHLMAQEDNALMLEILLKASSADSNIGNNFGASPLHYAAKYNAEEAANVLINSGASVNLKCNIRNSTPLHVAAACNSAQVANLLIKNGAKINDKNHSQETPLFLASATGSKCVLNTLLDEGAEIDARNIHGQTPLYIAVNYENFEIAKILIERGTDINAKATVRKETIFHLAISAYKGNIDFIKFLISKGADREARDKHGMTPFLRSVAIKTRGLSMNLLKLGLNPNANCKMFNFLDLLVFNNNVIALKDFVHICPRTNRPKLHSSLKDLSPESKYNAIDLWRRAYGPCPTSMCSKVLSK